MHNYDLIIETLAKNTIFMCVYEVDTKFSRLYESIQ